jgi:AcrR family transcriptional regulator
MPDSPDAVKPTHPQRRKPRGRFHHGDLREAAIAEATRMVDDLGGPAVSVRKIAKALGVTDPALYRHFANRHELLAEVGQRGYLVGLQRMIEAEQAAQSDREALVAMGTSYVRTCTERVGWFRLTHSRDFQDAYGDLDGSTALATVAARFEGAVKRRLQPHVPADHIDDQYRAFWAMGIGLATLVAERAFRRVETDAERLAVAERVVALYVDTLLGKDRAATASSPQPLTGQ